MICLPRLLGSSAPLLPLLWQATSRITPGGRLPQVLQLGAWDCAPLSLWLCRPSWRAASCLVPLVVTMVDHLCAAIGASRQLIMAEYDARTDEALSPPGLPLSPPPLLSIF